MSTAASPQPGEGTVLPEQPKPPKLLLNPWPLLGVLVFFSIGVVLVATRHWRRGSVMIGGSMVLAGLLRLLLPSRIAGLLAVRNRAVDVSLTLGAGVAMMVLGLVVPGVYTG